MAGTVLYMAPEQTLGVRHSSPASDQYSLAAILDEALTGEAPFKADGVYALIERIRNELARPPSQLNVRIPEALDDVILRALAREASRRFPSVRAFARALLPFANETTTRPLERDFVDRASASLPAGNKPSRPSIKKAAAEAETRHETREEEAPNRDVEDVEASSIRAASPLPCAPGESPFHIKGMPYRGLLYFVAKSLPGGVEAFTAALEDPRLRAFVGQTFLATVRYDVLPMLPLFTTLARLLDVPFDALVQGAAASQARYDARTVYQRILSGGFPGADREPHHTLRRPVLRLRKDDRREHRAQDIRAPPLRRPCVPVPLVRADAPLHTAEVARLCGAEEVETSSCDIVLDGLQGAFPLVRIRSEFRWRA